METIRLTINGREVEGKKGMTVLEVAQAAGAYIPTLCYHPDLEPYGGCRLCIVEIERMRGLPPACTTPAADGMVVHTETPTVNRVRTTTLELIIADHNADCLTCPANQRCELQKVAAYLGITQQRFRKTTRLLPVDTDNPLFERDYNLCILCARCTRMCQDVRGIGAISFVWRGSEAVIGTAFERPLRDSECRFCGACVEVCPTGALIDKEAKYHPGTDREAIINPCKYDCPANVDVPRYVDLIGQGRFGEALAVIREKVPFPAVLGRVCIHPCETGCRRSELNEPIAIRELKRFAAEHGDGQWKKYAKLSPPTGKKVAVVGSGPAGLTAAYYLAKLGHSVTVFEELSQPGGMMRVGIPDYRLPKAVLDAEIGEIENIGVDIKLNTRVESIDGLFEQGFDAVFLGLGAHCGTKMRVEGEDTPGVIDGVTFLRNVSLARKVDLGDKVAVIGGGNVAIDSARTALRLGAKKVTIVYRRTRKEMPASPEEVEAAIEEGINIEFLAAPVKITKAKGRLKLTCTRMELGEPDASGRRRPIPIEGSEFSAQFDSIIAAIGQVPDIPAKFNLSVGRGNTLEVEADTLITDRQGVYAGGDVATGPASVIEAIAAGRKAASAIDRYLGGKGDIDEELAPAREFSPCVGRDGDFVDRERVQMACLPVEQRIRDFAEAELGLDEQAAVEEAKRCLQCAFRKQISSVMLPPLESQAVSGSEK